LGRNFAYYSAFSNHSLFQRRISIMPIFGSPFSGFTSEHKPNRDELIRAVRFLVASEYEATQLYTQLADSIDHPFAQAVLRDVADEERVHAGQFLKLLYHLAPDEEKFYEKGAKENDEILKKVKK
jgi:rubrerythrin